MGVLLLPNVIWICVASDMTDALVRGIPPSIVFLVALVSWSRQPRWVLVSLIPLYALLPFEMYYLVAYEQPTSSNLFAVASESNWSEATEYIGTKMLLTGVIFSLVLVAVTLWFAWCIPPLPRQRWLSWLAWASLVPVLQYAALEWDWDRQSRIDLTSQPVTNLMQPLSITEVSTPMGFTLSESYPLGVFFRVRDFLGERKRIRDAASLVREFNFKVHSDISSNSNETYVLVIGESSNPKHWQLNGYQRPNNPKLTQLPRLVSFSNVVSSWPGTRLAVPVIVVGQQGSDHQAPMNRASVVTLFKQAGFHTVWISNQSLLGLHDSMTTVHASEADEMVFTNLSDYTKRSAHDAVVLPVLNRVLANPHPKKLIVIHTLGSHKRYDFRYPSEFEIFRPATLRGEPTDDQQAIVNSYDNTILFTDYVLAEIQSTLDRSAVDRAALLYVSDHGQTLPINGCAEDGHGRRNESDFRVAAALWVSSGLDRKNPEMLEVAMRLRDAPLESVGAFHTLADLAQLSFPDKRNDWSWVSTTWQSRPRWTNAVPDFDLALREPPCGKLKAR